MAIATAALPTYLARMFKRLFRTKAEAVSARPFRTPEGERIYAVGDIHGRLDLLDQLLDQIADDDAARRTARTTIVFLGDLPDRGPDSKGVIDRLMALKKAAGNVVFLKGNHEELLIRAYDGERGIAGTFNRAGGRETMMSYGVAAETYDGWDLGELADNVARFVPAAHIEFLRSFRDWYRAGDYLFVHAGIRPGLDIEEQDATDLRWIRRDFIESDADHGCMVIHGHTITPEVDARKNRIGIDTGAFASGTLTAIGLDGEDRWFLQT